jgi:type IV pilus assembly protein PilQ
MRIVSRILRCFGAAALLGMLLARGGGLAAAEDVTPAATPAAEPAPWVGETVTLSAQNLDVKDVLAMLSRSRALNVVCGPDVQGAVSIELRDVPFAEALQAVAGVAGLEVTRRGTIYFVRRPPGDDAAAAALRESRTFRLDYTTPEEVQPVVEQMLSPIGRIMGYAPRRMLVVEDRPEALERLDALLRTLDVPPRQVLIEARILQAELNRDMRFGINWSLLFSHGRGSGAANVEGFAGQPGGTSGPGLFVGWAEGDFTSALQSLDGVVELNELAAPRLLAVDGADARIIIGDQLGFYVTTTVDNTILQSVQFLDTGTQLRITPTITGDGYVRMSIHPELSTGKLENGLPSKTTAEVITDVLVRDGQTLFIGGLIQESDMTTRSGIPILMRLPLLGGLFGSTTVSRRKSELIALLTPHIVARGDAVPYSGLGLVPEGSLPEPR